MSAPPTQPITPQPEAPQPQVTNSTPLKPAKRELSTASTKFNAKVKFEGVAATDMAPTTFVEQPPLPSAPEYSECRYGVFEHFEPNNPSITTTHLVRTELDFNTAHDMLHKHAEDRTSEYPQWGTTSTRSADNMLEILGFDGAVHMRYQISLVHAMGLDVHGRTNWQPVDLDKSEEASDDDEPELYVMDIDLHCHDTDKTEHYITGGFRSIAEASNAMKSAANAYLEKHDGARLLERQIEIVDENAIVQQRFSVGRGRYTSNKLMTEGKWRQKQGQDPTQLATPRLSSPVAALSPKTPVHLSVEVPALEPTPTPTPRPRAAPKRKATLKTKAKSNSEAKGNSKGKGNTKAAKRVYCICRQSHEHDLMVKCDNEDCRFEWYHATCIGMKVEDAPTEEETWYCQTCVEAEEEGGKAAKKRKTG